MAGEERGCLRRLYLLPESFFDCSIDHIYLFLMQGLCRYPGLSKGALDHEKFSIGSQGNSDVL